MSIQTCPTELIQAPVERVWELLTTATGLRRWSGATTVKGPAGPFSPGDQVFLSVGLGGLMGLRLSVIGVESLRRLSLEVRLPFGILNREVVVVTRVSDDACRVAFN